MKGSDSWMNNNRNVLVAVLGGVAACVFCVAIVFAFPKNDNAVEENFNADYYDDYSEVYDEDYNDEYYVDEEYYVDDEYVEDEYYDGENYVEDEYYNDEEYYEEDNNYEEFTDDVFYEGED